MTSLEEQTELKASAALEPARRDCAGWAVAGVLVLHLAAVLVSIPPGMLLDSQPSLYNDHPTHAHRIYVFREALRGGGLPWGYDPGFNGGIVEGPDQGLGTTAHRLISLLLPWMDEWQIDTVFMAATALLFPLFTLLTCRLMGITRSTTAWILAATLIPVWTVSDAPFRFQQYLHVGMICFFLACFMAPVVLALALRFVRDPTWVGYGWFTVAFSTLFLLHCTGPLIIAVPLVALTLFYRPLETRWCVLMVLVPIWACLLNAFWLVPYLVFTAGPAPPWPEVSYIGIPLDLTFEDWPQFVSMMTRLRVSNALFYASLIVGAFGLAVLGKRHGKWVAGTLGLALATCVLVFLFGSFVTPLAASQPLRFGLGIAALVAFPLGAAMQELTRRWPVPQPALVIGATALIGVVGWLRGAPGTLPEPFDPEPVNAFVAEETRPGERILLQALKPGDYSSRILGRLWNREVFGRTRMSPRNRDPMQFLPGVLWGRPITEWQPDEMRVSLQRWGINWVFCATEEDAAVLQQATGNPSTVVGPYHAIRVQEDISRFLVGSGEVRMHVNRLTLTGLESDDGVLVLRYRYHPAWRASAGEVFRYPVPEDPVGLLGVRTQEKDVQLTFGTLDMLTAEWPELESPGVAWVRPASERP